MRIHSCCFSGPGNTDGGVNRLTERVTVENI
jgi:hypothetical protein